MSESDERKCQCPNCGTEISMIAAVGHEQRWGITIKPGPVGLIQAGTVAGTIDGAQKLMRLSCREGGANVQTYVEALRTDPDGEIQIDFITLPTSKKWAKANEQKDHPHAAS